MMGDVTMAAPVRFNNKRMKMRSEIMKKMMGMAVILLFLGTAAFGADWESRLPDSTPEQVRAYAREAVRAGVAPDQIITLTAKMEENRFNERLTIRALEIVINARQEKLPVEPILSKAREGIAKRIPAQTTVQAMATVHSRYALAFQNARSIVTDEKQQQTLGRTIAEGLTAGMQQRDMVRMTEMLLQQSRQLGKEQRNELAVQSFQTVRDMARLGVSSPAVGNVICQALQHQFSAQEMTQMRNAFVADAKYGKTENIAQQYGAQIGSGARAGGLGSAGGTAGPGDPGGGPGAGQGSGGTGGGAGGGGGGAGDGGGGGGGGAGGGGGR